MAVELKEINKSCEDLAAPLRTRILLFALETRRSGLLMNKLTAGARGGRTLLIAFLFTLFVVLIQK
jgi:hypothetical protein